MNLKKLVVTLLISFMSIMYLTQVTGCTRVGVGQEGIKVNMYGTDRGVQSIPIVTGMVFYNPITSNVYEYPTFNQTVQYKEFSLNTKEGASVEVDPAITLSVVPGKAPLVYQQYHAQFQDLVGDGEVINLAVKNVFRDVLNEYTMDQIVTDRQKFEADVFKALQANFNAKGFQISQLTSGLKLPDAITKSITAKTTAVQEAQIVDNQLQTSKALLQKAQIDAQTTQVQAAALTPLQIQSEFIKKWDGHSAL